MEGGSEMSGGGGAARGSVADRGLGQLNTSSPVPFASFLPFSFPFSF